MTTTHFKLSDENWFIASDVWGRRFTGNFEALDYWAGIFKGARCWSPGVVFHEDDIILDDLSMLLMKATTTITVPGNTQLLNYALASATRNNVTFIDRSCQYYAVPAASFSTIVEIDHRFVYRFRSMAPGASVTNAPFFYIGDVNCSTGGSTVTFDIVGVEEHVAPSLIARGPPGAATLFATDLSFVPTTGVNSAIAFAYTDQMSLTVNPDSVFRRFGVTRYESDLPGQVNQLILGNNQPMDILVLVQYYPLTMAA